MNTYFQCPECTKELSSKLKRCACGWGTESEEKSKSPYQCQNVEFGVRCTNEGTSSNRVKGNYWYCKKHSPVN